LCRLQPLFSRVATKDVGETGRDHHSEAVVQQRPHGVLTGRSGTEVRACHEAAACTEGLLVQHEVLVTTPCGEQSVFEASATDTLEVCGGDDLIGAHVGMTQPDTHPAA